MSRICSSELLAELKPHQVTVQPDICSQYTAHREFLPARCPGSDWPAPGRPGRLSLLLICGVPPRPGAGVGRWERSTDSPPPPLPPPQPPPSIPLLSSSWWRCSFCSRLMSFAVYLVLFCLLRTFLTPLYFHIWKTTKEAVRGKERRSLHWWG